MAAGFRKFKQIEGKTIAGMIFDCRMKKLVRLLKTSSLPIKKITAACGFNDEFHIKRRFKRLYGVSMKEYRRQAQSPDASTASRR